MALAPIPLLIVLNEGRFIVDTSTPDVPLQIPVFTFGDKVPIKLEGCVRLSSDASQFDSVDLSDFDVELSLGIENQRPSLGFFTIAFGATVSEAFPVKADAFTVEAGLGGYTVTGSPGNLVVSAIENGAQSEPTVDFTGDTEVEAVVTEITPGSATTLASWRIELREEASAKCVDWDEGSTTPVSTCVSVTTKLFRLQLDGNARSGFFFLLCQGTATDLLQLFVSPSEIENNIRATGVAGNGATVLRHPDGGFLIKLYDGATTLTVNDTALVIPANITGQLDLTGEGVRNLIDGNGYVGVLLTVRITDDDNNVVSEATAPVVLQLPIERSA